MCYANSRLTFGTQKKNPKKLGRTYHKYFGDEKNYMPTDHRERDRWVRRGPMAEPC